MEVNYKIIMLPSNRVVTKVGYNPKRLSPCKTYYSEFGAGNQSQYLYLVSNEEIKEGDWVINLYNNFIFEADSIDELPQLNISKIHTKIISSTNKSLGLPKIPEILIKTFCDLNGGLSDSAIKNVLNSNINHIEEKLYTKKEVRDMLQKAMVDASLFKGDIISFCKAKDQYIDDLLK